MLGFDGNNPDDNSDVMLLYSVGEVPTLTEWVDISKYTADEIMSAACSIWIFGIGFFCSV